MGPSILLLSFLNKIHYILNLRKILQRKSSLKSVSIENVFTKKSSPKSLHQKIFTKKSSPKSLPQKVFPQVVGAPKKSYFMFISCCFMHFFWSTRYFFLKCPKFLNPPLNPCLYSPNHPYYYYPF